MNHQIDDDRFAGAKAVLKPRANAGSAIAANAQDGFVRTAADQRSEMLR